LSSSSSSLELSSFDFLSDLDVLNLIKISWDLLLADAFQLPNCDVNEYPNIRDGSNLNPVIKLRFPPFLLGDEKLLFVDP
tara:strand:+ start:352 stop:591 length:240 start_codon:yes stop_codon:yes gene_type:complete